jgi:ABC-type sugar transport system ATPase subunit
VTTVFRAGEIVGLVGKNGAGKSTLIKILGGATPADNGVIRVDDEPVRMRSPHDALTLGIAVVHQDLALIPDLSVAENVWLGLGYPRTAGPLVDRRSLRSRTEEILDRIGLRVSADVAAGSLGIAAQRLVMIARGLAAEARLLILDEPSASFTEEEIGLLHGIVRSLGAEGVGTVYVSHRVAEVLALTERVVVMRGGAVVDDEATSALDRQALVAMISGGAEEELLAEVGAAPLTPGAGSAPAGPGQHGAALIPNSLVASRGAIASGTRLSHQSDRGQQILRVQHLAGGRGNRVIDASLEVHSGEILGIAGLVGSGRTELVRLIFGCERPRQGSIVLRGRPVRIGSPQAAVRQGIALVPEDRRNEGALLSFSVAYNTTLPSLSSFRRWKWLRWPVRRLERRATMTMMDELGVVASGPEVAVATLSGGNQQKVVVGKWLMRDADVFIFDEPSTGIDVYAKAEMFRRIAMLAAAGKAVIVISSEFEELEDHCHRVIIMREGRTVGELAGDDVSEAAMVALCYGDEALGHRRVG